MNLILENENYNLKKENIYIKNIIVEEKQKLINKINEIKNDYLNENLKIKKEIFESNSLKEMIDNNNNLEDVDRIKNLIYEKEKLLINNYEMFNKIQEFNEEINKLNNEKNEILIEKNNFIRKYENILNDLKINELKYNNLQKENEKLKENILNLNKNLNDINNKNDFEKFKENNQENLNKIFYDNLDLLFNKNIDKINNLLNEKDKKIFNSNNQQSELNENIKILKINNDKLNKEIDNLKNEKIELLNENYKINLQITNLNDVVTALQISNEQYLSEKKNLLIELSNSQSDIIIERQKFFESDKLCKQYLEEKNILKNKNEELQIKLNSIEKQYHYLENNYKNLNENNFKIIKNESNLLEIKSENTNLILKLNEIYQNYNILIKNINEIFENLNINNKEKIDEFSQLKIIKNEIENCYKKISNNNEYYEEIYNIKKNLSNYCSLTSDKVNYINNSNLPKLTNLSKIQIFEKIIRYISYLKIIHSLQLIKISLKSEEKTILYNNIINNKENNKNIKNNYINNLNLKIEEIKNKIENDSVFFENRLKNLINDEEVNKLISDLQKNYEKIISNIFENLLKYRTEENDKNFLCLKIPIQNYNNLIEYSMNNINQINNYIKEWNDSIKNQNGEQVDNAFNTLMNITNLKNFESNNIDEENEIEDEV